MPRQFFGDLRVSLSVLGDRWILTSSHPLDKFLRQQIKQKVIRGRVGTHEQLPRRESGVRVLFPRPFWLVE
jgi:hypothetical protein